MGVKMDIKDFIDAGGTISYGYKKEIGDWVCQASLCGYDEIYYFYCGHNHKEFLTWDKAFAHFKKEILSYRNLCVVLRSLEKKGLYGSYNIERDVNKKTGQFYDDENGNNLKKLIKNEIKIMRKEEQDEKEH